MAKKKKKRKRSAMKPSLAVWGGLIAGVASTDPSAIIGSAKVGNWTDVTHRIGAVTTGFGFGKFDSGPPIKFWTPIILGALIHKFVGGKPLNVNRYLSGLPISI